MPSTVLKRRGLGFIIVLMVLVSLLFLIVPYAVGVGSSRVYPAFPFIRFRPAGCLTSHLRHSTQ
jgi:hypothetical protein